jgi:hypothetical protein
MMLAKDRSDRYHTADDLLQDLECLRRGDELIFAKPKVDLGNLLVQVTPPEEQLEIRSKPKAAQGNTSPIMIASIILNILLLILLVVVALG